MDWFLYHRDVRHERVKWLSRKYLDILRRFVKAHLEPIFSKIVKFSQKLHLGCLTGFWKILWLEELKSTMWTCYHWICFIIFSKSIQKTQETKNIRLYRFAIPGIQSFLEKYHALIWNNFGFAFLLKLFMRFWDKRIEFRSSYPELFCNKAVVKNFPKSTG